MNLFIRSTLALLAPALACAQGPAQVASDVNTDPNFEARYCQFLAGNTFQDMGTATRWTRVTMRLEEGRSSALLSDISRDAFALSQQAGSEKAKADFERCAARLVVIEAQAQQTQLAAAPSPASSGAVPSMPALPPGGSTAPPLIKPQNRLVLGADGQTLERAAPPGASAQGSRFRINNGLVQEPPQGRTNAAGSGRQPGITDFTRFEGTYLITNYGLFRGRDVTSDGQPGFYVLERTDLYTAFRPGDLFFRARRASATPMEMTLITRERSGDGSQCPDTDGRATALVLHRLEVDDGLLVLRGERRDPPQRYCAARRVNARTCQEMECVQWSETLTDAGDELWIVTDDEAQARKLYAALPKWTRANRNFRFDTSSYYENVVTPRSGSPWGDCGLEGCEDRRRREAIDQLLIDMWSQ